MDTCNLELRLKSLNFIDHWFNSLSIDGSLCQMPREPFAIFFKKLSLFSIYVEKQFPCARAVQTRPCLAHLSPRFIW